MSVEDSNQIDFVSLDGSSGDVVLTIADHLDWNGDESRHLQLLQDKLNAYLHFALSGQLLSETPAAAGRKVVVNLRCRHAPSPQGRRLIALCSAEMARNGVTIRVAVDQL